MTESSAATRKERWLARALRVDQWLEAQGERLNPILIKEARQALKSRQFVMTFTLLLVAVWGWTMISTIVLRQQSPNAQEIFFGYFLILEVPLLVMVPFAAFRSLAAERDDGTFELVAITALDARQIVNGKLASALLQVMIYFSALAPCIGFTYLLRGIDFLTIAMVLTYTLMISVGLVIVALLLATAVGSIHWQLLASVGLVMGLLIVAFAWPAGVSDLLRLQPNFDETEFWHFNAMFLTMYLSLAAVLVAAAASQLSFPSDNRSTPLRIRMALQQALFVGWMVFLMARYEQWEVALAMGAVGIIYWTVMGAMMTGERSDLSPRVKRTLPQSWAGRALFTWFLPGSGAGYAFAVCNIAVITIAMWSCYLIVGVGRRGPAIAVSVGAAYAVLYLGIGRLALLALRRVANFGVVVALLVQALIAALAVLLPLLLQALALWSESRFRYTWLQIPNWAVTLGSFRRLSGFEGVVTVVIPVAAGGVLLANLLLSSRELLQFRELTPTRVLEDEQELRPAAAATVEAPSSPWD